MFCGWLMGEVKKTGGGITGEITGERDYPYDGGFFG